MVFKLRPRSLRERLGLGESRREREARERQLEREHFERTLDAQVATTRELLRANATAQGELLKAVAASSNVFSEYLKLITSAGKPAVRDQGDEMEAFYEAERAKARPARINEFQRSRELGTALSMVDGEISVDSLRKDLGI